MRAHHSSRLRSDLFLSDLMDSIKNMSAAVVRFNGIPAGIVRAEAGQCGKEERRSLLPFVSGRPGPLSIKGPRGAAAVCPQSAAYCPRLHSPMSAAIREPALPRSRVPPRTWEAPRWGKCTFLDSLPKAFLRN